MALNFEELDEFTEKVRNGNNKGKIYNYATCVTLLLSIVIVALLIWHNYQSQLAVKTFKKSETDRLEQAQAQTYQTYELKKLEKQQIGLSEKIGNTLDTLLIEQRKFREGKE